MGRVRQSRQASTVLLPCEASDMTAVDTAPPKMDSWLKEYTSRVRTRKQQQHASQDSISFTPRSGGVGYQALKRRLEL